MMDDMMNIYKVEPGCGRFGTWRSTEPGEFTMVHYMAPSPVVPGINTVPASEDSEQWQPVFGIKLSDPRSADAWSNAFSDMAKRMRSELVPVKVEQ